MTLIAGTVLLLLVIAGVVGIVFAVRGSRTKELTEANANLRKELTREQNKTDKYERALMQIGAGKEMPQLVAQDVIGMYNNYDDDYNPKELNR